VLARLVLQLHFALSALGPESSGQSCLIMLFKTTVPQFLLFEVTEALSSGSNQERI
jgi:hypothetical protein